MKKIAIDISVLNEKNKTGVGVYTYQLIKHLLKINKKDEFILFGIATLDTYNFLKNIEFKNNPNVELKIYKMPAKFFRGAFLLWQKLNWPKVEKFVGEVDIFHSFNWNLPPVKSAKTVASVFDMTPILFPDFHQKKTTQLDKKRLERIKKYADLVITISKNSKKDFLNYSAKTFTEVIYPGINEVFLNKINKSKSKEILRKYNLDKDYILAVGTIEPRKNIKALVEAFLKMNSSQKLVLVGKWGWEKSSLMDLIKQHKDRIFVIGFIPDEDLPYIYNNASVFVYPSFYEGFGIPVLEAFNSGVPVIVSKNSSLIEVGEDSVMYIDPNSMQTIINALEKIQDKKLREKLISKGYNQAKKFSWEESAKKLNDLYQLL